jgi:putative hydrolase of the HAD superfamily
MTALSIPAWVDELVAVTFDFGNTLVPVDRAGLVRVVDITARAVVDRCGPFELAAFMAIWAEERERQFREDVPQFREVDLEARVRRVLARLRGMSPPPPDVPWDDAAAAAHSAPDELAFAVEVYSRSFIEALPAPPGVRPLLDRLARRWRVAIVSNWPLATTIDRYVTTAGWSSAISAVVVSQRVGAIKPDRRIFRAAESALGLDGTDRARILHVGDDWAADVVGAHGAGWRTAYLAARPEDSPLPSSVADGSVVADLEVSSLDALAASLGTAPG